ncbi:hypothetical protein L226DRAFT_540568 [Lentinus tigrinus ALCF2SS1-7]|uniref:Uncharacterized protein n=1 Tax=Lentinus tigrinus ALCF2SS1-6 TaxID=1328759 RepID=A0A5C2RQF6_9APHY|nr:hypothetical protein L227DRAFT_581427 [Lentinus tigrinus ALCF2SS1-6]RPD68563.1 hypothetical protein L226DRAFT_540568 [Lentinus tigrinus ALCF2SS1-7]
MVNYAARDPRELRPYPPPPSSPSPSVKRTYNGLTVARSTILNDRPADNGNSAVVPAAIAVAVFVATTLVVLKLLRMARQHRRAVAAHRQIDELELPRMWEVRLSASSGQGRWSDLMPVAAEYMQEQSNTSEGHTPVTFARPLFGHVENHTLTSDEHHGIIRVTVLVTMPSQLEADMNERHNAHVPYVAIGTVP